MDKKSRLLKNLIKQEMKQEPGRLPSLNVGRDLNLGGSKPRKQYAPNLNAVRNKNKSVPSASKGPRTATRRGSPRPARGFASNTGRFVQSSGLFSEGTVQIKRPTLYSDKHASVREAETNTGMIKPKLGNTWNINVKDEEVVVEDLLACDESNSENEDEYEPIVLPLSANKDGFINTFKVKSETDAVPKQEPPALEYGVIEKVKPVTGSYYPHLCSFTSTKDYDEDDFAVSLVKMPDSLPGKGFDDDNNSIDYSLSQMIEGKIGKIIVRRSGKIDMVIGKTKYTLDAVEAAQFQEELMCMPSTEELKRDPSMTSLGSLEEKFVISPIWSALLPKRRKYL